MSGHAERIGQPATPLSRTLATIHSEQGSPGLNPRELLLALDRLIAERLWEGETGWDGQPMTLARALTEAWPVGVGMTAQRLERLYALAEDANVDPALVRRVREAVDGANPLGERPGPKPLGQEVSKTDYPRLRLRRDRPDLYRRVLDGELTVHEAAIEAGIVPARRSIPIGSPEAAIRALLRVFGADELRRALDATEDEP